jgi:hypothetical protein
MTKMVSLAKKFDGPSTACCESDSEYYPSLYLDKKQIDALDLDNARVGTEMMMLAKVRVSSMSESKDGHRSMSFEIVEACINPKEADAGKAASVLYPDD